MEAPSITAAVTTKAEKIAASGVLVYIAENREELERVSLLIAKSMKAVCHKLSDEVYIIVQH